MRGTVHLPKGIKASQPASMTRCRVRSIVDKSFFWGAIMSFQINVFFFSFEFGAMPDTNVIQIQSLLHVVQV